MNKTNRFKSSYDMCWKNAVPHSFYRMKIMHTLTSLLQQFTIQRLGLPREQNNKVPYTA